MCQNESFCELNHSSENEFRLQVHFHANQNRFQMKFFVRKLDMKIMGHKITRKWPIAGQASQYVRD